MYCLSYLADPTVFRSAPRGDQENLYLSGLSLYSGAGKPPQNDSNEVILPPRAFTSSMHSRARRWSMPTMKN